MSLAVHVDFGLLLGATIPTDVLLIGDDDQGIIGTNVLGELNMLADYSDRLQSISVQRTCDRTSGTLLTFNAGTISVRLLNDDGALDPYALEQAGLNGPGVVMRLRARFDDVIYPIFYGFVDSWEPEADAPELGYVTVTATDGLALLNQQLETLTAAVGADESVYDRVVRILDDIGWPAEMRELWDTSSILQSTTYGAAALDLIREAVKAEVGDFYQKPDGLMFMRGRHATITDSRSQYSQAWFGSDWDDGEIPYQGRPGTSWTKDQLHTRVTAQIEGSDNPQVAENSDAANMYGTSYTIEDTSLPLTTDAEALSWAYWVLATDYKPIFRFTAITVNSEIEAIRPGAVEQMLSREMGDRVTVIRRPPAQPFGSIVDSRELYIRGISHEWSVETRQWLTSFDLQPVEASPYFVIGSPEQGVIGQDVLVW